MEQSGTKTKRFLYDEAGLLIGFSYQNGSSFARYYYIRDQLGHIIGIVDAIGTVVVRYTYDAWGNILSVTGTLASTIGAENPFRYKGYYYDSETGYYYCQSRYYVPLWCRWLSSDKVSYLDPESINGINLYMYCGNNPVMYADPSGNWSWNTFFKGLGMITTAVFAVALAVTTFGAGIPLIMVIVSGITLGAGILTGINGIATIVEAGTEYNFVRDGLFNEVFGISDKAYDYYAGITEGIAIAGSMILGFYHTTGQYKAAKAGQNYLGKGYVREGTGRWVSKDGMRQMRIDAHPPFGNHFNIDYFKINYWANQRTPIKDTIHIIYDMFKKWLV